MKIPKEFNLMGQTIKVEMQDNIAQTEGATGVYYPSLQKILIQKSNSGNLYSTKQIEQAFVHELIHSCLDILGYKKLYKNESFVDRLAHLIYQALESFK